MDSLGRPIISSSIRDAINEAFIGIEGRGAILIIADGQGTRAHLAAKFGNGWKVAGGGGFEWMEKKPYGWVGLEKVW